MSGLLHFPKGQTAPPNIAGIRVPTSMYSIPIPIVYGTARLAGNLIQFPDPPQIKSGSKVARRSKGADQTNTYSGSVVIGLCEGPIDGINLVWTDKTQPDIFSSTFVSQGWFLRAGSATQTELPYLLSAHPEQALRYPSLAYVANPSIDLPNGSVQSYSWEIQGLLRLGGLFIDTNAADVLLDFLTNVTYGLMWPSARIASLSVYRDYVNASGLFLSPVYNEQRPAGDQVHELLSATNTAAVWSDGVLKIVPYGDTPLTGNGATYTPNTTPLYDLTDDDFLADNGQDPVRSIRKPTKEAFNQLFVEFEDRTRSYAVDVIEAKIEADIALYGLRPAPKVSLPAIKDRSIARLVAQLILQRLNGIRKSYEFRLGWRYALLEPMDLVTLTDSGLGLNRTPVRILEMVELEDEKGFDVTAEEWPFGVANATNYPTHGAFAYTSAAIDSVEVSR